MTTERLTRCATNCALESSSNQLRGDQVNPQRLSRRPGGRLWTSTSITSSVRSGTAANVGHLKACGRTSTVAATSGTHRTEADRELHRRPALHDHRGDRRHHAGVSSGRAAVATDCHYPDPCTTAAPGLADLRVHRHPYRLLYGPGAFALAQSPLPATAAKKFQV